MDAQVSLFPLPAEVGFPGACSLGRAPRASEGPAFAEACQLANQATGQATDQPASLPARPTVRQSPESLHPSLWRASQLARYADSADPAQSSGFKALDAQLPGGGWPHRVLTELLLAHPGVGEIRLLSHCLALVQRKGRLVMFFDPPAALSSGALAHWGIDVDQLLVINTRSRVIPGSDTLWALEQALKSGHVGAVVAWLPPRLRTERLRRLQLVAHSHDGPAFVLREPGAQQRPTAAPLRLLLRPAGADVLAVRILKRRGPTMESPLLLALPSVLPYAARQRALAGSALAGRPVAHTGALQPAPVTQPLRQLRQATFVNLAT